MKKIDHTPVQVNLLYLDSFLFEFPTISLVLEQLKEPAFGCRQHANVYDSHGIMYVHTRKAHIDEMK